MSNLTVTASSYAHTGLSVIPTLADKRPACAWKEYTQRIMSDDEIARHFGSANGIGIVCGAVSGNLELLDFDDRGSAYEPWLAAIPEELRERLVVESTPSGGRHVYYRVEGEKVKVRGEGEQWRYDFRVEGNRKLAMKEDGHVLIETRGEGGYVKCAPSEGYALLRGSFMSIPKFNAIEAQLLINAAVTLDEKKVKREGQGEMEKEVKRVGQDQDQGQGLRSRSRMEENVLGKIQLPNFIWSVSPWDDYNCRGDLAGLLEAHGWKRVKSGDNEHWERPGKDEHSTSATWNGTVFYVFSSNAWGFEPNKGYNKFQVFAQLECRGDVKEAVRRLRSLGYGRMFDKVKVRGEGEQRNNNSISETEKKEGNHHCSPSTFTIGSGGDHESPSDPGALPEELLHIPGFVDLLVEHTLATAPYPNRPLAFAGALAMLSHLTGRNYRNERNLRTNVYLLALADSGVGKDYPRKVNMNLAAEVGAFGGMGDRFASSEGLEDALLVHPSSFFQVDEIDTLFASLNEKGDSAMEKIYGSLLQFATSADSTYAMRKKAISQVGGRQSKFDKIRARGIREPHLVLFGTGIPKYLWSSISTRAMENGLLSRCLVLEAGDRGKAGTPHFAPFSETLLTMARALVAHGGFDGLDLEKLDTEPPPYIEPMTVAENDEAKAVTERVTRECEALYDAATDTAAKALWTRGAEKTGKLALLYAISENVYKPVISAAAVEWAWKIVKHLTLRTLYQASVYVHESEFDALRQKAIRYLRDYGGGSLNHGVLLRYMHVDADTFRRVIDTLHQSELITVTALTRGGFKYTLI